MNYIRTLDNATMVHVAPHEYVAEGALKAIGGKKRRTLVLPAVRKR